MRRGNVHHSKVNPTAQKMRVLSLNLIFVAALGASLQGFAAQQVSPAVPPVPPSEASQATSSEQTSFDPFRAEKSIEVGTYYMKRGKYDAAIDRFTDATRYHPKLARPWRLMGEAYEKKKNYPKAIESYQRYLEVYASPEDAAKVNKRIARLQRKVKAQESAKRTGPPR